MIQALLRLSGAAGITLAVIWVTGRVTGLALSPTMTVAVLGVLLLMAALVGRRNVRTTQAGPEENTGG